MARKSIIQSAAILTAAGLITRILGFVYRIYMSNIIGAEGMGLYQLIMPVYALAWSISCSGFTTAISKLVSQERAKGQYGNMCRILKQSICITGALGCILSVLLFVFAKEIALYFFRDERLTVALKILSLSFPFMSAGSCVRGYFFGLQEAKVPAISQVFEQCIRMSVIYILSFSLIPKGLEYACAAAVMGIAAGEFLSFFYVIYAYRNFKLKNNFYKKPNISSGKMLALLLSMAMPLTLNRVTGSLLSTMENMLLPQKLQAYGLSASDAISEFGKVTGMAMPLIQFPSAILISLSISLVPAISEAMAVENYKRINYTISKTMLFTSVTGIGAAGLFILFSDKLGLIIYKQDISEMLIYLGIMCPFIYMQTTLSGILNGLGEQIFIFRNSLLSSFLSICAIFVLVPNLGLNGYILGSFISLMTITTLNLLKIKDITKANFNFIQLFFKPLISILSVVLTMNLVKHHIYGIFGDILGLITAFLLAGIIYAIFIFLTGCLAKKDIQELIKHK